MIIGVTGKSTLGTDGIKLLGFRQTQEKDLAKDDQTNLAWRRISEGGKALVSNSLAQQL